MPFWDGKTRCVDSFFFSSTVVLVVRAMSYWQEKCFTVSREHGCTEQQTGGGKQQNQCTAAWPQPTASGGVAQRAPRPAGKRRPPYHLGVPGRPSGTSVNAPRSSREAPTPIHFHRAALRPGEHNETITRRRRLLHRGQVAGPWRGGGGGGEDGLSVCSSAVQRRWAWARHTFLRSCFFWDFSCRGSSAPQSASRSTVHGRCLPRPLQRARTPCLEQAT
jgi:hypothetical protein